MIEIKTFRARTLQQAFDLVRQELGPEATVLHTRELNGGVLSRFWRRREYEIAASNEANVPSRLQVLEAPVLEAPPETPPPASLKLETNYRELYRQSLREQLADESSELEFVARQLTRRSAELETHEPVGQLFEIYAELIEADIEEPIAQEYVDQLRSVEGIDFDDRATLHQRVQRLIEKQLRTSGPLQVSAGSGRVVALVGPTGVGKTTTIAKLAANYRLRERKTVGLITVDTYRIAAVEQLRTYADIIDLPMEVVSTPREMREAVARMRSLDLVLMDTAGRSPRDQIRIQELKTILAEANPDEVHLVLSAVGSARCLTSTAEQFSAVGTTRMIVTKLDEATALGNLVSLCRQSKLPMSYVTDGQNVPDDIRVAQSHDLARLILEPV